MLRSFQALLAFQLLPGTAFAQEVFTESFDDPFEDWWDRWLAESSNLNSYYAASGGARDRGNQPFGIWISDDPDGALVSDDPVSIEFLGDFGDKPIPMPTSTPTPMATPTKES